jgi:hypothetical protein
VADFKVNCFHNIRIKYVTEITKKQNQNSKSKDQVSCARISLQFLTTHQRYYLYLDWEKLCTEGEKGNLTLIPKLT